MSRPRFLADLDLNEHIVVGVFRREPAVEFTRARQADLEQSSDDEIVYNRRRPGVVFQTGARRHDS